MPRIPRLAATLALAVLAACSDRKTPTEPTPIPEGLGPAPGDARGQSQTQARHERLARRVALALRDDGFRAAVLASLDGSPFREGKIHLQRYLTAAGGAERRRLARLSGEAEAAVETDLTASAPIELYLPVPEHRRAWRGGLDVLVATAEHDGDTPVAFDPWGRRRLLDPLRPPTTPVLALGRAESRLDPFGAISCIDACEDDTGGSGGSLTSPGLNMTYARFVETFESWMKGSPEFEVHILGREGTSNAMKSYQCAGEHAGGYYAFDQNSKEWSGNVLLFSQAQLDSYKAQYPGEGVRILVLEDDDGACQIKMDSVRATRVMTQLQTTYNAWTAGRDSVIFGVKNFKRAQTAWAFVKAVWSWITTQDDLVGFAIEDQAATYFHPSANWIVKTENNVSNGGIRLQMR